MTFEGTLFRIFHVFKGLVPVTVTARGTGSLSSESGNVGVSKCGRTTPLNYKHL